MRGRTPPTSIELWRNLSSDVLHRPAFLRNRDAIPKCQQGQRRLVISVFQSWQILVVRPALDETCCLNRPERRPAPLLPDRQSGATFLGPALWRLLRPSGCGVPAIKIYFSGQRSVGSLSSEDADTRNICDGERVFLALALVGQSIRRQRCSVQLFQGGFCSCPRSTHFASGHGIPKLGFEISVSSFRFGAHWLRHALFLRSLLPHSVTTWHQTPAHATDSPVKIVCGQEASDKADCPV